MELSRHGIKAQNTRRDLKAVKIYTKGLTGDKVHIFQRRCLELACVRLRFSDDAGQNWMFYIPSATKPMIDKIREILSAN
jgi:hypothetical protein